MLWWGRLSGLSHLWLEPPLPPPAWLAQMVLLLITRPDIGTCNLVPPPSASFYLFQISFAAACRR